MSLTVGSRLGAYEVLAPLGAGGMGEVFRARDTKLGREVALKILPPALASDPERLARFEREAQLLAALNHPNIAAIHGVEDSTATKALVLELVEGPTLADRIAAGRVPVRQAVEIARQMAEALAAAHERGIVHRDLKPANVKLDAEDRVKVLDFGLAKALDPIGMSAASTTSPTAMNSPTLTAAGTQLGVILGTAAYMAPEQARGGAVDKRADIFAFGCVLYEMLTAKRAFEGDTVSDTLAAVLRAEPDWSALPSETPPALRTLLARCLDKDRKRRLSDIGDARFELDAALAPPAAAPSPGAVVPSSGRERLAWGVAAALALALAAAFLLPRARPEAAVETPVTRLPLELPDDLVLELEASPAVAISPDGRRVIESVRENGRRRLLLRNLDTLVPRLLDGSEGAWGPIFSPDGEWIAYYTGNQMKRVAVAGGPPIVISSMVGLGQSRGAVYEPGGALVLVPTSTTGLHRIASEGQSPVPLTTLDAERLERTHRWPALVPGRSAILFTSDTVASTEYYDDARIEAVEIESGKRHVVLEGASRAVVVGDELVFARGGSLFASAFDRDRLAVSGAPRVVLQGVATDVSTGAAHFDVSASGTLVYVPGSATTEQRTLAWYDLDGNETPGTLPPGLWAQLQVSEDGRYVALSGSPGATTDIWIHDLERGTVSRLTFEGTATDPVFTRDGQRIAFSQQKGADLPAVFWTRTDGSGAPELLYRGELAAAPRAFSPDGRFLVLDASRAGGNSDLVVLPLEGERQPFALTATAFDEYMVSFSPDGGYLAYNSNETGTYEIYVRPFPQGDGKWQVSTSGGTEPRFSGDGRWLFYRNAGELYRAPVSARPGFVAGAPQQVSAGLGGGGGGNPSTYALSPDGRRILRLKATTEERDRRSAAIVFGWAEELRRSRPAKKAP